MSSNQNSEDAGKASDSQETPDSESSGTQGRKQYRRARAQNDTEGEQPEPNFQTFLAGLYTQTLGALGVVEGPGGKRQKANLEQAQYLIDILGVLKDKTEGNLDSEERGYLLNLLQDLRMRYVQAAENTPDEEEDDGV